MCTSRFMFFANDLLLAVYFIFTEIMLDKKQIQVILFQCKMGNKAADTPHNINNASKKKKMHLAQELPMNVQCSGGSRSFAKEMRILKTKSVVAAIIS